MPAAEPYPPVGHSVLSYGLIYHEALHRCDTGVARECSRPNEDGALPSWTFRPRVAVAEPIELWTARRHLRDGADENDPS